MRLESNIRKLNLIIIFSNMCFWIPIIALFFLDLGLSMTQIFLLQSAFGVGVLVFEIPSGYFADIFGRKTSIILHGLLYTIGFSIYFFGDSFNEFLAAEFILSIGYTMLSGADSALLYDTLKAQNREKDYKKEEGVLNFNRLFFNGFSAFMAGFIVVSNSDFRITFLLSAVFNFIAMVIAFTLIEPPKEFRLHEKGYLYHMYKILRFAVIKNKHVRWLSIFMGISTVFGIIGYWYYQPYMQMTGVPLIYFGIIFAAFNVVAAIASKYAYVLEKHLSKEKVLLFLSMLSIMFFFLLGNLVFLFSFLFIFIWQIVRGATEPIIKDYINKIVYSDKRATVLSIQSMMGRTLFVALAPLFGLLTDKTGSIPLTLNIIGVSIALLLVPLLILMKKDGVLDD